MSELAQIIAAEINRHGPMSFARFMELALYCPVYGYYEKEGDNIGREGDFYTSVSTGALFGELLACQFAEWLVPGEKASQCHDSSAGCHTGGQLLKERETERAKVRLVEAGAHRGELASDIINWLARNRASIFEMLEYWIIEPSALRRQWQQQFLDKFGDSVRWADSLDSLKQERSPACSVIFSNELLDSMPVHRFGWDHREGTWFEWGVTTAGPRFTWTRLPGQADLHASGIRMDMVHRLAGVLPDGFTIEVCPTAMAWWRSAATSLEQGKLLTIDYGITDEEMFAPARQNGTLRAYRGHHLAADPLADPGEQDLTAHVHLSAIQRAGEAAGLKTDGCASQTQFLTSIAARTWKGTERFDAWTPARIRQFQTLTHPEHLGRAFRVLLQSRS